MESKLIMRIFYILKKFTANNLRIILLIVASIVLLHQLFIITISTLFAFHLCIYGILALTFTIHFIVTVIFIAAVFCDYTASKIVWISSILSACSFHMTSLFGLMMFSFNFKLVYWVIPQQFIQHIVKTPDGCTTECKFEKDMSDENQLIAAIIFVIFNFISGHLYVFYSVFTCYYYNTTLENKEKLKELPIFDNSKSIFFSTNDSSTTATSTTTRQFCIDHDAMNEEQQLELALLMSLQSDKPYSSSKNGEFHVSPIDVYKCAERNCGFNEMITDPNPFQHMMEDKAN